MTKLQYSLQVINKSGLHIIDDDIVPHYDRFIEAGMITEDALTLYERKNNRKVTRLNENQAIIYQGDTKEKIGY